MSFMASPRSRFNIPPSQGLRPRGGLPVSARILTTAGSVRIDALRPESRIITHSGAQNLRNIAMRAVHTPLFHVRHGAFGVGRPAADLVLPGGQLVLLRGALAQQHSGRPRALVAIDQLHDGTNVVPAIGHRPPYFALLQFPREEIVYADGLEVALFAERPGPFQP